MENHIVQLKIYQSDIDKFFDEDIKTINNIENDINNINNINNIDTKINDKINDKINKIKEDDNINNIKNANDILNEQIANARNLIINSGITRKTTNLFNVTGDMWPSYSIYDCLVCCHDFKNAPVGIPEKYTNNNFYLFGNFCSYNCAKRYLCPDDSLDDNFLQMSDTDKSLCDDNSNKIQLLELLCHIETNMPVNEKIKKAETRLTLKKFGGYKTIEEFRSGFNMHNEYHIYKSPLISIVYQLEEINNDYKNKNKTSSAINSKKRIEQTYKSKSSIKQSLIKNITNKYKNTDK